MRRLRSLLQAKGDLEFLYSDSLYHSYHCTVLPNFERALVANLLLYKKYILIKKVP